MRSFFGIFVCCLLSSCAIDKALIFGVTEKGTLTDFVPLEPDRYTMMIYRHLEIADVWKLDAVTPCPQGLAKKYVSLKGFFPETTTKEFGYYVCLADV